MKAAGKIIYLMKVTEKLTFNSYWKDARFQRKKPLRNGSMVMMVGDNIYHKKSGNPHWIQLDSHHSNTDGTPNIQNLARDTSFDNVLVSDHFYYFGKSAINANLSSIGYANHRGHSKKSLTDPKVLKFIKKIELEHTKELNLVADDPYDFLLATRRVDQSTGRIA